MVGLAALSYVAITLAVTWPLITCLGTRIAGAPGTDGYSHVWMHWLSRAALLESGMLPFGITTDLLYWPAGGKLHSSDPLGCLLGIPLQSLFGEAVTYNTLVIGHLSFAATCMFVLARRATGNVPAAFAGGLAYGFCPYLLAEANNGAPELLTAGWLPLLVLLLARVACTSGWTGVLPAAAVMCVTSLFTWYYGVCAILIVAVHCVFPLEFDGASARPFRTRLRKHAAVFVLFGVGIAPFLAVFLDTLSDAAALVYGGARHKQHAVLHLHGNIDVAALLNPFEPGVQVASFRLPSYLGLASVALALFGLALRPAGRRFWLVTGLVSLVLALGPILVVDTQHATVGGHPVWLPFALVSEVVPPLASLHFPRRLMIGAVMTCCLLGAAGVAALMEAVPRRWAAVVAGGCVALIGADLFLTRNVPVPVPTSTASVAPVFEEFASAPGRGAVLVAPVLPEERHLEVLHAQTVHGHPLQVGMPWVEVEPRYCSDGLREITLVRWLAFGDNADGGLEFSSPPDPESLTRDVERLVALGFTHVLLHTPQYTPQRGAAVVGMLDEIVAPGDRTSPPWILYTLSETARPAF